jgi:hypothetical protein
MLVLVSLLLPAVAQGGVTGSFTMELVISNVSASSIGDQSATISWQTNGNANSQVFYDTQFHENVADYAYQSGIDPTLVAEHSIPLTGLSPSTTYHYRAKSVALVDSTEFIAISQDYTFATLSTYVPPSVVTVDASHVGQTSAVLWGMLTRMGTALSVQVYFEWGETTDYGFETTHQILGFPWIFSATIASLTPGTTYHYRAVAVGDGTAYGDDMAFTTGIPITGITGEVNCNILPFADVKLMQGGTVMDSTASDAAGNYLLTAPAPGTYEVVVDKDGWRPQTQQITISSAGTITRDFIGQTGLVPNAPSIQYVAQCSNHYLYPYGNCGLTVQRVAAVSNAYLYPVSE